MENIILANWSEAEIHEVNSIPLVIQFKVMPYDTEIAVGKIEKINIWNDFKSGSLKKQEYAPTYSCPEFLIYHLYW